MKIFITGGAGFIGCNCAKKFIQDGDEVIIFDNLSRVGTNINLKWLKGIGKFQFIKGDIRDYKTLKGFFRSTKNIDAVLHLAAQTAVTTSISNPMDDFEVNASGTLNLLESIRLSDNNPLFIYASTNKVYGCFENLNLKKEKRRYALVDYPNGIAEDFPLDFHSPYGCSKGVADQYVRDYYRVYGARTVVFRQSCIYGPRQFGVEDQGWVAWFIFSALKGHLLTIFGDGLQVRDLLYIDDLVNAFSKVIKHNNSTIGEIYNIGGGPRNQLSLIELVDIIEQKFEMKVNYRFDAWRAGDQRIYLSDTTKCYHDFGWKPEKQVKDGLLDLYKWSNQMVSKIGHIYN